MLRGIAVDVFLVEYPGMGAVLVDYHQPRLHRCHYVAPLVLIVGRRLLGYHACLPVIHLADEQVLRLWLPDFHALVEFFPVASVLALAVGRGSLAKGIVLRIILHLRHYGRSLRIEHRNVGPSLGVEVYHRNIVELAQGFLHCRRKHLEDGLLVLELYLGFHGMDVHVDVFSRHIYIYKIRYLLPGRQQPLVGIGHGTVEERVAHIPVVGKEELGHALLASSFGLAHKSADAAHHRINRQGKQVLIDFLAENVNNPLALVARPEAEQLGAIAVESELHLRIDKHYALERGDDIVHLGRVRLEKLSSCRHIIKQVIHLEVASFGTGTNLLPHEATACNGELRAHIVAVDTCLELHLGHGSYRGKSLAAEPHRVKCKKVGGLTYLGSGMAFKAQARIGSRHTLAVVDYLNEGASGIHHKHVNLSGLGIDGVLYEFLYHRCRALYHLTSGYLIGHGVGQQLYNIAHRFLLIIMYNLL